MIYDKKITDEIRQRVSIVEIIGSFINLNKKANNFIGLCPFHDDKHASLTVNEDKKIYKCFSCNNAGDVFTFLKNLKHISYYEAVLEVAKIANLDSKIINQLEVFTKNEHKNLINYEINEIAYKYYKLFLQEPENKSVLTYLHKRGLTDNLIERFKIGYAPNSDIVLDLLQNKNNMVVGSQGFAIQDIAETGLAKILSNEKAISFFKNRITFAIYNENNKLVAFSGRNLDDDGPKYINTATTNIFNKHEILYNLNHFVHDVDLDTVYLVEGFMDVIALHKLNIINAVATMGVAFNKSHLVPLARLIGLKNVILCFDNDEAGKNSIDKTAEIILNAGYEVFIVQYKTEHKDIDEILNQNPELAAQTLNDTIHYYRHVLKTYINQHPIISETTKLSLVKKAAAVLNQYKNPYLLETDIKWIVEQIELDDSAFRSLITNRMNVTSNKTLKSTNKFEIHNVQINTPKKHRIPIVEFTESTEKEILKCCLLSIDAHELFFKNFCGFAFDKNIAALNVISDFYTLHPEYQKIAITDLTQMTNDPEMLAYLTSLIIELQQQNLVYTTAKLEKVISTHIKKLVEYKQSKIVGLLNIAETDEEKQKLLHDNDKIKKMKR